MKDITKMVDTDVQVNVSQLFSQIEKWIDELEEDPIDDIIYTTLESVVDLVLENCEGE